ncbi:MAG: hypothetical protein COA73_08115 [Candidatus Hydrogenedentota bacterium]|nr:MAG: hypothetical protein COA73_08115 [Candidatus Hydrogenedentota bacterium]
MDKNAPKNISDIIESLKASSELGRNLEEAKIWDQWPSIVGPKFQAHSNPLGVRDRVLIIEVDSAVWMHKISYEKPRILTRIAGIIQPDLIDDIYLSLSKDDEPDKTQDSV